MTFCATAGVSCRCREVTGEEHSRMRLWAAHRGWCVAAVRILVMRAGR
jgi:hypothetical protein